MVMECNYGGGLFLEFQPLTDCMLCEGVGHPYCRLYYLWKMWGGSSGSIKMHLKVEVLQSAKWM